MKLVLQTIAYVVQIRLIVSKCKVAYELRLGCVFDRVNTIVLSPRDDLDTDYHYDKAGLRNLVAKNVIRWVLWDLRERPNIPGMCQTDFVSPEQFWRMLGMPIPCIPEEPQNSTSV